MDTIFQFIGVLIGTLIILLINALIFMTFWNFVILDIIESDFLHNVTFLQSIVVALALRLLFTNTIVTQKT